MIAGVPETSDHKYSFFSMDLKGCFRSIVLTQTGSELQQ